MYCTYNGISPINTISQVVDNGVCCTSYAYSGNAIQEELQICEEAKETLRTEKNDFMTRYEELLQQQKGWESAIADRDAAKVRINT